MLETGTTNNQLRELSRLGSNTGGKWTVDFSGQTPAYGLHEWSQYKEAEGGVAQELASDKVDPGKKVLICRCRE